MSQGFQKAIQKFDGDFPVSHLNLAINNNLNVNVYGVTYPPNNYVIKIEFNENRLGNLSDLGKATTIIHETIHAEIYRKMLSAAQRGDLNHNQYTTQERINYVNSMKNNFPGLYNYYWENYHPEWNHNLMADHYRKTISDMLQEFDNNRLARSVYEAVAWAGLGEFENNTNTTAWSNLTPSEQQSIKNLISQHFFNGPSNCN